jgi:serine/threonine protein kinase
VVIGTGSFGDVFAGAWKGQKVAIKQFMKQKVTDEVLLEMRTESGILSAIEHPNIIRFLGMCIKIPHLCIVTELLERGSLSTILLGNEPLSWAQRKSFATDIAKGMEYLHKNNIIHRDVKSPNMLVAADWTIKIGDFGFSRVKSENRTMTQCGTVAWTAPEIFLGERYSEKADVYSYSVILWELVYRKKPWQGMNSMKVCHAVENGERLSTVNPPSGTPEYIIKLMEACWLQDHERRPSFTEVLKFLEQQR